jgi:radical SAM superfamily enzyme YgiQ (UPF0313 family)
MKILLVNTNQIIPPIPPIGLLHLGAYLETKGHQVQICDLCLQDTLESTLRNDLETHNPDIVGVTIRNIDNVTFFSSCEYLPFIRQVIGLIKANYQGPIVLGGAGYSIMPVEILAFLEADFGIVGEGEFAFKQLLEVLANPVHYADISGLVYRENGVINFNPPQPIPGKLLDTLPFQHLGLVNYREYFNCGGYASISTARGCAMECSYCTYPIIEGKCFRARSAWRIVDEIELFLDKGYDYFNLTDSVFNFSCEHVLSFCKEIIKRGLKLSWNGYLNPITINAETVTLMLAAGCNAFYVGVDSCSDKMLNKMRKGFSKSQIIQAATTLHSLGCDFGFWLLLGGPGETRETLLETFDVIDKINPVFTPIMYGIRVFPGTALASEAIQAGTIKPDINWLVPQFYISPDVADIIEDMVSDFIKYKSNTWAPLKGSEFTINSQLVELYKQGIKGPPWRMAEALQKIRAAKETYK